MGKLEGRIVKGIGGRNTKKKEMVRICKEMWLEGGTWVDLKNLRKTVFDGTCMELGE